MPLGGNARSPSIAGIEAASGHQERGLRLVAELDQIADAGAGDPGICNGPILLQKSFCTADQKFSGLYTRLPCKDVGDLIA